MSTGTRLYAPRVRWDCCGRCGQPMSGLDTGKRCACVMGGAWMKKGSPHLKPDTPFSREKAEEATKHMKLDEDTPL